MKVIYTAGVFDLLHYGHRHLLRESAALGDRLVVGVVADASYKNVTPVWDLEKRLMEICKLPEVDLVLVQRGTDPSGVLNRLNYVGLCPAAMTHGGDWDRLLEGNETLRALGIEWVRIPLVGAVSSTEIRNELERLRHGPTDIH